MDDMLVRPAFRRVPFAFVGRHYRGLVTAGETVLVTQLTMDRMDRFVRILKAWPGPVSLVVLVSVVSPEADMKTLRRWVGPAGSVSDGGHRPDVEAHLFDRVAISVMRDQYAGEEPLAYAGRRCAYPVNTLRNLALATACAPGHGSDIGTGGAGSSSGSGGGVSSGSGADTVSSQQLGPVLLVDADFLPSRGLGPLVRRILDKRPQSAVVVPAFDIDSFFKDDMPSDRAGMLRAIAKDKAWLAASREQERAESHGPTRGDLWTRDDPTASTTTSTTTTTPSTTKPTTTTPTTPTTTTESRRLSRGNRNRAALGSGGDDNGKQRNPLALAPHDDSFYDIDFKLYFEPYYALPRNLLSRLAYDESFRGWGGDKQCHAGLVNVTVARDGGNSSSGFVSFYLYI
jgi:hypothetical protein